MMRFTRKIVRFVRLSKTERRLFVEASAAVLAAQVALSAFPYRMVHVATRRLTCGVRRHRVLQAADASDISSVAAAVEKAGRQIPGARCLARALAGSVMLARHGHACVLRIGVRRPDVTVFEAHAWLEQGTEVVVGGPVPSDFVAFPPFEKSPSRESLRCRRL